MEDSPEVNVGSPKLRKWGAIFKLLSWLEKLMLFLGSL